MNEVIYSQNDEYAQHRATPTMHEKVTRSRHQSGSLGAARLSGNRELDHTAIPAPKEVASSAPSRATVMLTCLLRTKSLIRDGQAEILARNWMKEKYLHTQCFSYNVFQHTSRQWVSEYLVT